jgi:ribosome-associated heat shock protein Hsp15
VTPPPDTSAKGPGVGASAMRLDKWLWQARIFRSRSEAAEAVTAGAVRLDGRPVAKPGRSVAPGATLTLVRAGRVRVLRILALPTRRGPAAEAAALYLDLDARTAPEAAAGTGPIETPAPLS